LNGPDRGSLKPCRVRLRPDSRKGSRPPAGGRRAAPMTAAGSSCRRAPTRRRPATPSCPPCRRQPTNSPASSPSGWRRTPPPSPP